MTMAPCSLTLQYVQPTVEKRVIQATMRSPSTRAGICSQPSPAAVVFSSIGCCPGCRSPSGTDSCTGAPKPVPCGVRLSTGPKSTMPAGSVGRGGVNASARAMVMAVGVASASAGTCSCTASGPSMRPPAASSVAVTGGGTVAALSPPPPPPPQAASKARLAQARKHFRACCMAGLNRRCRGRPPARATACRCRPVARPPAAGWRWSAPAGRPRCCRCRCCAATGMSAWCHWRAR